MILHSVSRIRPVSTCACDLYIPFLVGPHAVRKGQLVYINDTNLLSPAENLAKLLRQPTIRLRTFLDTVDPLESHTGMVDVDVDIYITAQTAQFGADLSASTRTTLFGHKNGVRIRKDSSNQHGCKDYGQQFAGDAILVWRGECTFLEKLIYARNAGASGVIVISDDDELVNPSATVEEIAAAGDLEDVALVLLPHTSGKDLAAMVEGAGVLSYGSVLFSLDHKALPSQGWTEEEIQDEENHGNGMHILYVNGRPLLNTRLLVP